MKVIYLDCSMGAAGDMLMAALYELLDDKQTFLDTMRGLGLPGIEISAEPAVKCGITGTHMKVLVHGSEELDALHDHLHEHAHEHSHDHEHHHHTGLHEIEHLLSHLDLPQTVRDDALAVYHRIAEAESKVHRRPVDQIHFHEVGTLDALADVVGVCLLMHLLAPEKVYASSVHVGCGQVKCAHGILPVPAPATALLLAGVPIYGGAIQGELCTPTGAALLTHFVTKFGELPSMQLLKSGYGMGTKDFPAANCVRAMLGEQDAPAEEILELSCNLDDCTGETIGFAMERLLDAGALDVYWTSVGMKKNRPGILLTCMCRPLDREKMVELLFKHTTTLGVRESVFRRYTLSRESKTIQTPDGDIRVKVSSGYGVTREKPEFDDLAKIARETGKSLSELQKNI
ncbi:MAG: nickel pincer cofactor biosynthesis protein LarC [Firmicutes bacterium]|nr:nickel pincer cofactor biosynthesis protein LarC [Bacillota bacterium]